MARHHQVAEGNVICVVLLRSLTHLDDPLRQIETILPNSRCWNDPNWKQKN